MYFYLYSRSDWCLGIHTYTHLYICDIFAERSLKASEERQILSPTEVKKRRKRHETQTCVEICFLLDLLWLANHCGSQKSAEQKSAAAQKSETLVKPVSGDAGAESSHAFAWSLNFAGRLPSPVTASAAGGDKSAAAAVGKTSWRQAAAAAIEAKKNAAAAAAAAAASASGTNGDESDSAKASRFALIEPTAADACGARVLLALLRITDAFQVRIFISCRFFSDFSSRIFTSAFNSALVRAIVLDGHRNS